MAAHGIPLTTERNGDPPGVANRSLEAALYALKAGQLVIMPTETVYGLAGAAARADAVAAIFAAKGRPGFNPLIAHVCDADAAGRLGVLDERALALTSAFWPGPLTLVARLRPGAPVCDLARAGLDTVALRAPAHPLAQALLQAFDGPIAAPSANRSGRPSPTTLDHALEETGSAAAAALDGGPCAVGLESTVVSLLDGPPRLLRPGAVTREALEAVIGPLADPEGEGHRSPGRLTRHYAPAAPVRLNAHVRRDDEAFLAFGDAPCGPMVFNLSSRADLHEAASNLFAMLRAADALRPRAIVVAPIPEHGLGQAINDRLRRAAGHVG